MELKDLHRVPFMDGMTFLADRPTRRLSQTIDRFATLIRVYSRGLTMHDEKERGEDAERNYKVERGRILDVIEYLTQRGIHGIEVVAGKNLTKEERPLRIWWFRSVSWRVTDLRRFMRSKAFRSKKARSYVTIKWPMDVMGPEQLKILESIFGPEIVDAAKVSINKEGFQRVSSAKRPPVGTKEVDGQWSIKTDEQWDDEDEENGEV